MVRDEHPEAVLLRADGLLYWTGAMHLGISHILAHATPDDFTLLLNDDLLFANDLIERLLEISRANPRALVQAVESCVDDTDIIWQGGVRMNWWTAKHLRLNHHRRISEFPPGHLERSDYLTGRGVFVPMEVFRTIGNYDASYKQYGDPEFARRAAKHGYALLVAYQVAVLSYDKGQNLNEAESYALSDFKQYYFGTLSSASLRTRWKNAMDMTESAGQAVVFYCCDVMRITWHFFSRLKLRSAAT
jgi:GT2 family glycosyltransferase